MRTVIGTALTGVLLIFASTAWTGDQLKRTIQVEGYVHDASDKPLAGASVLVFPIGEGGKQQKTTTNKDGSYRIELKQGVPINVLYRHSKVGSVSISYLSGQHDQRISKLLADDSVELARNPDLIFDSLRGLEFVLYQSRFGEEQVRPVFQEFGARATMAFLNDAIKRVERPERKVLESKMAWILTTFGDQ
jgi:hypothetical protein